MHTYLDKLASHVLIMEEEMEEEQKVDPHYLRGFNDGYSLA